MKNQLDVRTVCNARQVYLIGIGGAGMSGLARLLYHSGLKVSGSDVSESATTKQLRSCGIDVYYGQKEVGFSDLDDLIIFSSAISESHLELSAAKRMKRNVYHRAQVLSCLFNAAKTSIGIAGTHGKTTTSSMISFVLSHAGKNPTCFIGGEVINFGTNALLGNSDLYVSEVDESDQSHELFAPNYLVLTNLEEDHVDRYSKIELLRDSFRKFIANLHNPGLIVYSEDDLELRNLVLSSDKPRITVGFSLTADYSAQNILRSPQGVSFDLYESGFYVNRIQLKLLGLHNVSNALAAIAVLIHLGVDSEIIKEAMSKFQGARRRLEIKWQSEDLIIVNDYAHHPTEVLASINALKDLNKNLTVIFQPHRFSRTQHFFKQFGRVFNEADQVILTDIYGAGEQNLGNINISNIYDEIMAQGHPSTTIVPKAQIISHLNSQPKLSGVIAFLGAGDIGDIANDFANRFKSVIAA